MRPAPSPRPLVSLDDRASGILLHPTSLPGRDGCGDLGSPSHHFVEWLGAARQRLWQMLPLGPVGFGNSPYSALSAFAGSPLLLSLEALEREGWLGPTLTPQLLPVSRVDYERTARHRNRRLREAYRGWKRGNAKREDFDQFRRREAAWLEDFALYSSIKGQQGGRPWILWPSPLRDREPAALAEIRRELSEEIELSLFEQWVFDTQWTSLRAHCHERGISLVGDIPIFVAHDSADVWSNRDLFRLDPMGRPEVVAGVPPDYFSKTGQKWGNPLYRWEAIKDGNYAFWIERFRHTLKRFDFIRLDHFIGFVRNWEIPPEEETAIRGAWTQGPGIQLFQEAAKALGLQRLPFIAEDLGAVTKEVLHLRDELRLPGIKILQFAFGTDPQASSFKPYNYPRLSVAYTGTHDNDTSMGWLRDRGGPSSTRTPAQVAKERELALRFLGSKRHDFHWNMIWAALGSVANFSIFPLQDVLGLGSEARMNQPGTWEGNWEWRLRSLPMDAARRLGFLTKMFGRAEGFPS